MADNSTQTGADTIATDDVTTLNGGASSGVKVQRVKNTFGDDGTSRDVSSTYPMPTVTPNSYTTGTITAAVATQGLITSGTATANSSVQITVPENHSSFDVFISGTFSAGTLLYLQGSLDGTNWFSLNGRRNTDASTNDTTNFVASDFVGGPSPTGGNPSNWRGVIGAIRYFRVIAGTLTASDSVSVQIATSAAVGATFLNVGLPASSNLIGSVKKAPSATTALTSVAASASSVTVLAANSARLGATVFNDSTAALYLGLTSSAVSTTSFTVKIDAGSYYELPNDGLGYVGALTGIWSSATGSARVTELSA